MSSFTFVQRRPPMSWEVGVRMDQCVCHISALDLDRRMSRVRLICNIISHQCNVPCSFVAQEPEFQSSDSSGNHIGSISSSSGSSGSSGNSNRSGIAFEY